MSESKGVQTTKTNYGTGDIVDSEDYVVKSIGAFGAWQAKVCFLASSTRFIAMWNMMNIIFLTHDNEFICVSFNGSAPVNVTPSTCYADCTKYDFAEGLFVTSFVSEFEVICDRAWMASFTQTMLMFGLLFGVSLFGWISDRFGRRVALILSAFLNVTLMMGSSFAPNYWVFSCLRFLIGMGSGGVLIVGVVVVLEVVGPQHRELAGCCVSLPDGLAEALLVTFVYFSPTWRVYLFSFAAVSTLIAMSLILLSETPRWLMANGRLDEVRILLASAAKFNNLNAATVEENINTIIANTPVTEKPRTTYCDLFRTKKLAVVTISSIYIWAVCGVCYFGINQYATFLGSNVYVSVIILGLIQIPTCFLGMWLNKVFGRKPTTISTLTITGLTMFFLMFAPPGHWSSAVLGITGLSVSSTTFNIIYVYVSELFPTPLRNMGYGVSSAGAKMGGMLAPFAATLSPHWIPSLIFAVLPLTAAAVCLLLPETKGQKLRDELE